MSDRRWQWHDIGDDGEPHYALFYGEVYFYLRPGQVFWTLSHNLTDDREFFRDADDASQYVAVLMREYCEKRIKFYKELLKGIDMYAPLPDK